MITAKLPEMVDPCQPCLPTKQRQISEKLPDSVCQPCTDVAVENPRARMYPSVVVKTFVQDCFGSMLKNMCTSKFCSTPPESCSK